MAARTALLFQTHFFDHGSARAFSKLRQQVPQGFDPKVLIHLPPGVPVPERLRELPHHVARTTDLRHPAYMTKCSGADLDLLGGGHTDLIMLHFFRAHPDFDRYWLVEYDVRFSGDWRRFFEPLEAVEADLLAPILRSRADQPDWSWWHTFLPPQPMPPKAQLCAFMPIHRVSRDAILAVDAALRAGWAGHSEAVWPTAIAAAGLRLVDPGGDGPFTPPELRGRFYSSTMHDILLAPGTLMFRPPLFRPGTRPDMLWHPVKPFWLRVELRQAVRDLRADLGRARRDLVAVLPTRSVRDAGSGAP